MDYAAIQRQQFTMLHRVQDDPEHSPIHQYGGSPED